MMGKGEHGRVMYSGGLHGEGAAMEEGNFSKEIRAPDNSGGGWELGCEATIAPIPSLPFILCRYHLWLEQNQKKVRESWNLNQIWHYL